MKRLCALALSALLSVFLVAAANAESAGAPGNPKPQQGLKNAKKAMQGKLERDKKVREVKKQAYAKRQQAQSGK